MARELLSLYSYCCRNSPGAPGFPPRIVCGINSSGNPAFSLWTPAFAGVTSSVFVFRNRYYIVSSEETIYL